MPLRRGRGFDTPTRVTRASFAQSLLTTLGYPTTTQNLKIIVGWTIAEDAAPQFSMNPASQAQFNPLGSTQDPKSGNATNDPNSSVGVKSYSSWGEGIRATADTITNGHYSGIIAMLKTGKASTATAVTTINGSVWGTHDLTASMIDSATLTGGVIPTASPGGTAGAGGTGTLLNDSSGFQVGNTTNPDEDYWTAINRLCQDRYWYCFSDGETLYIADGPDLMKQTPAMSLDRIQDSGIITHLDLTFDNTAWQYAVTHHKRRRAQRRTALAKVTSPVEGILDVICRIDEVRAGDVVELSSTGPGDGQWLAGDVRRSVFELTSEVTLVPPLAPLTEGQLNPAQTNSKNASLGSSVVLPINVKGYVNPVGAGWQPGRIDQGCDGRFTNPFVAPGDSRIVNVVNSQGAHSWEGYFISGVFLNGSLKGKTWYVAEGITPLVHQGSTVGSGTPIARSGPTSFSGGPGSIETGWASPDGSTTLAQTLPGYTDDVSPQAVACGDSFNRFLVKLGAPPCARQGSGIGVVPAKMPGGYP